MLLLAVVLVPKKVENALLPVNPPEGHKYLAFLPCVPLVPVAENEASALFKVNITEPDPSLLAYTSNLVQPELAKLVLEVAENSI